MDDSKIKKGQKAMKELEAGTHTNLELLRKALNKIVLDTGIDTPEELNILNELFNN